MHAQAQAAGKSGIFAEFRLRVAQVDHEITLNEAGERQQRRL
jgi:hypothetical protein